MRDHEDKITCNDVAASAISLITLLVDDGKPPTFLYDPNLVVLRQITYGTNIVKVELLIRVKRLEPEANIPVYQIILTGNALGTYNVTRIHSYRDNWRISPDAVIQMRRGTPTVDSVLSKLEQQVNAFVNTSLAPTPLYKKYSRPCTSTLPVGYERNLQPSNENLQTFETLNGGQMGQHRNQPPQPVGNTTAPLTPKSEPANETRTFYYSNLARMEGVVPVTNGIFIGDDRTKPVVLLRAPLHHQQGATPTPLDLAITFISTPIKPNGSHEVITDDEAVQTLLSNFHECPPELMADIENLTGYSMEHDAEQTVFRVTYIDSVAVDQDLVITDTDMVCIEQRIDDDSLPSVIYLQRLNTGGLALHCYLRNVGEDTRFPIRGTLVIERNTDLHWLGSVRLALEDVIVRNT